MNIPNPIPEKNCSFENSTATRWFRCVFPICLSLLLGLRGTIHADSFTAPVVADTFITSGQPGNNDGGNAWFDAGTDGVNGVRRGLLRFNLSGIPAGSTITSAVVQLTVSKVPPSGPAQSAFDLYRLQAAWGEGNKAGANGGTASASEATWLDRTQGTASWISPGAADDAASSASASTTVASFGTYSWSSSGLVSDVQLWLDNPAQNFGWLLRSSAEETLRSVRAFAARENGSSIPVLQIGYTPAASSNSPPSVAITSPTNGASFTAPATVTITANATDSDGTVTNVQFFDGATSLGNDGTSPFSLSVNLSAGSHTLTAVATDNQGATNRSAAVTITVIALNTPPTVTITSPTNNASFPAGAAITIQATASDSDGSVASVQFFDGTISLGSDSTSPFGIITNLSPGAHTLTAVATDNQGATNRSSAVVVTVVTANAPPAVAITSPTNGASFTAPATVTIAATATDSDGSVTNVQFFDGAILLGSDNTSPFSIVTNLTPGSHTLTAVATDNQGATNRSLAVVVAVVAANTPPTVAITSPTNGASFTAPATVTITATATDSDGTVTNLQFFDGATSLGNDSSSPFSVSANLSAGSHTLTAVATDNQGATNRSAPVTIAVITPSPIQISSIVSTNADVICSWTGGLGPFALQKKLNVDDPIWRNVNISTQSSARVIADRSLGIFRVADTAQQPAIPLSAYITGINERPTPLTNSAIGFGMFSLEGNTLTFDIRYSGLSGVATMGHIHGAATTATSTGIQIDFASFNGGSYGSNGTVSGTAVVSDAQKAMILAGQTYVNFHTAANPGGEMRGQIAPVLMQVALNSANENPPVATSGNGLGIAMLVSNQLSFNITYRGLSGTATMAHIHGPATSSTQNVAVIVDLQPFNAGAFGSSGTLAGTVALTPAQLAMVIDGQTYVNFHTAANPGGEIRGQLVPQATALPMTALVSGLFERPTAITNSASGAAFLSLEGDRLAFSINYRGLSGPATMAHIHGAGNSTESVGVQIDFAPFNGGAYGSNGTVAGSVPVTPAQRDMLLSGRTYVNFHTSANPGGEIRGQIAPVLMRSTLSGAAERPDPVSTSGTASGTFALVLDKLTFDVTYRGLTSPATDAHIHAPASVTESAGAIVPLGTFNGGSFGSSGSLVGTVALTPSQMTNIIDQLSYVNIHTTNFPGGEIRGQLIR